MKYLYTPLFLLVLSVVFISTAIGQVASSRNTILLTWQAKTYTPRTYVGKALPTTGSNISFSLEVFSNGQLAPLGNKVVRWYEQGKLIKSGIGLQSFDTKINVLPGNDFKVRVEIPDFPGGAISKTISLRVVSPKIVIEAPFPNLQTAPKDFSVKAVPYFFSIFTENSLTYQWLVNGSAISGSGDPQALSVSTQNIAQSKTQLFSFRVTAQNPNQYIDKGVGEKSVRIRTSVE